MLHSAIMAIQSPIPIVFSLIKYLVFISWIGNRNPIELVIHFKKAIGDLAANHGPANRGIIPIVHGANRNL